MSHKGGDHKKAFHGSNRMENPNQWPDLLTFFNHYP